MNTEIKAVLDDMRQEEDFASRAGNFYMGAKARDWADRLSAAMQASEPVAWTGKGCGVMKDAQKRSMIEEGKYGGEFASAARLAERHDIPLYALPPPPAVPEDGT